MNKFKTLIIKKVLMPLLITTAAASISNCNGFDIIGTANATTDPNAPDYRVFVTSAATTGDMSFNYGGSTHTCLNSSGINRANCFCQDFAQNANITTGTTTFRAWLSDSTISAKCNIMGNTSTGCDYSSSGSKYVDMMGNTIFNSWSEINNGTTPTSPVNYDQNSGPASYGIVYTGTSIYGTAISPFCNNGTSDWSGGGSIISGDSTLSTSAWTNQGTVGCSVALYAIYCFEGPQ